MTLGTNTYSNISSIVQDIYEGALLVARENALATGLVTVFSDRSGMALRKNFEYGTATINAVGESDDLASQVFTPSLLSTLTPAEFGAQFLLTDQRVETDPFGVRQDAAQELGISMANKIDLDILGNFNSMTGGTVGASGTAITWGYFYSMAARLQAQYAPKPWMFVCHPYQWKVLAASASVAASSETNAPEYLRAEISRNYFVQRVAGVDIFVSANVEASGTDAYVGMFSRAAIAYDLRRAPRLEPERDASKRAWELNLTSIYAHGTWRPKWGIQGLFDNTAPTS